MDIYTFKSSSANNYWCPFYPEGETKTSLKLGEESLAEDWNPWHLDIKKAKRKYTDFPALTSGIILLSEKAYSCYQSLLRNIEILPCSSDEGEYFILNILNVVDCFDSEKSIYVKKFGSCIRSATKYEFYLESLVGQHIFKTPEGLNTIYVSDEFVKIAKENDLKGLDLGEPIWSSK